MALEVGSRLGHYDVTALIGEGGMGQVYQATDTKLNRQVALKILPEAFATDPDRLARFQREAQVLASLNHPNIAAIHGLEESGDTRALVLELVEGPTLADRLSKGPIPIDEALPIAKQIAEALEAAHEAGVIHRDLKPANIKVKSDGTVKVLDFGLAKALDTTPEGDPSQSPTLTAAATQMGVIMGTAAYMSPEQAAGQATDKRSDIWSFGVVLFEMLTGQRIFSGETVSHVLGAVLQVEPTWQALRSDTPPGVVRLLQRCLLKDRKKRLPDIGVARFELDDAAAVPRSADASVVLAPPSAGRPFLLWVVVTAVVATVVTAGVMWNLRPSPAPESPSRFVVSALPSALPDARSANTHLAISPDGGTIVYRTSADGVRRVYVRRVDRLEGELLQGVESPSSVFFSPDGRWLGFTTGVDQTLKKIQIAGGAAITLCPMPTAPRGASWGPDDTIIFARYGPGLGLFRVSAAGGEPEVLTTPESPERHYWPEVLPSGRAVLFTIGNVGNLTGETSQIAVLNLDTQEQRVLIQGGTHSHYVSGHLVYSFNDTLRAVRFDADRLEVLSEPIPVLEEIAAMASGGANVDLGADGSLVYQQGGTAADARTLVWVDRQGDEELVEAEPRPYAGIALSPDGGQAVLQVDDPDNQDLVIYDLARDTPTRFTFADEPDRYPIWTPDGERVIFASGRDGLFNLYWKAADGTGQVERLTTSDNLQGPVAVSPDGVSVLFEEIRPGTNADIGLLALDGDPSVDWLLEGDAREGATHVSPDGRWMATASNESGQPEIYVRPFPNVGDGRWQISRNGGVSPRWGPDSRELFFQTSEGPGSPVPMMLAENDTEPTFSPGIPRPLFDGPYRFGVYPNPWPFAVSPDGERFLMIKQPVTSGSPEQSAPIILVQHWIEELRGLFPTSP